MARHLHELEIRQGNRLVAKVSAHLDVEGDQAELEEALRRLLLDAVERDGWPRKKAWQFEIRGRRPGWRADAFPPYVIPREEL